MFPDNIVRATFEQVQTKYVKVRPKVLLNNDPKTILAYNRGDFDYDKPTVEYSEGMNVLGKNTKKNFFLKDDWT